MAIFITTDDGKFLVDEAGVFLTFDIVYSEVRKAYIAIPRMDEFVAIPRMDEFVVIPN